MVNKAICAATVYNPTFLEFVADEYQSNYMALWHRSKKTTTEPFETKMIKKSGDVLHVLMYYALV